MSYLNILSEHLLGGTEKIHDISARIADESMALCTCAYEGIMTINYFVVFSSYIVTCILIARQRLAEHITADVQNSRMSGARQ